MSLGVVRRLAVLLGALVFSSCLAGCVDKSPDRVKLTAKIEDASLTLTAGSLVTTLGGSFKVVMAVGDLAAGSATVTDPPSFELVLADDQSSVTVLDAVLTGESYPITVKSGEERTFSFSLTDGNTLEPADVTRACGGPVQIAASLDDTLTGDRPTAFESAATTLAGCP